MAHEYRTPPDLRPIQTAAARGGTVHQLASSEVDAGKSEVKCGSVPPSRMVKKFSWLCPHFFSRDLSFDQIDGSTKGRCRAIAIFYVQSEMLQVPMFSHQLRTAFSSILLD